MKVSPRWSKPVAAQNGPRPSAPAGASSRSSPHPAERAARAAAFSKSRDALPALFRIHHQRRHLGDLLRLEQRPAPPQRQDAARRPPVLRQQHKAGQGRDLVQPQRQPAVIHRQTRRPQQRTDPFGVPRVRGPDGETVSVWQSLGGSW